MSGSTFRCTIFNGSMPHEHKDMRIEVLYPPKVRIYPNAITILRNQSFEASCIADGKPDPIIRWYFQDFPNQDDNEFIHASSGRSLNISVPDVRNCRFHDRNLTCAATNNHTISASPTQVSWHSDKVILPVRITGCENVIYVVTPPNNDKEIPWILLLMILFLLLLLLLLLLGCLLYVIRGSRGRGVGVETQQEDTFKNASIHKTLIPSGNEKEPTYKGVKDAEAPKVGANKDDAKPTLLKSGQKSKDLVGFPSTSTKSSDKETDSLLSKPTEHESINQEKKGEVDKVVRAPPSPPIPIPDPKQQSSPPSQSSDVNNKSMPPPSPPKPKKRLSSLGASLPWSGKLFAGEPKGVTKNKVQETFIPEIYEPGHNYEERLTRSDKSTLARADSPVENIITDDPTAMVHYPKPKVQSKGKADHVAKGTEANALTTSKGL